jgi:hypothetical protein
MKSSFPQLLMKNFLKHIVGAAYTCGFERMQGISKTPLAKSSQKMKKMIVKGIRWSGITLYLIIDRIDFETSSLSV